MTKKDFIKFLSYFDLTHKRIENILSNMEEDFSFEKFASLDLKTLVGQHNEQILSCANSEFFESYLKELGNKGVNIIVRGDEFYPEKLERIDTPPYYLFCKGDLNLLKEKSIAIIGTRSPSNYGRIVTERFAGELAEAGVVIISGLAYGVDGISHKRALEVKGKTIAVLGSGFDNIYPASHTNLANDIIENGLLISEYKPSTTPTKFNFPQRNRIVAGLSDGVLITEAGEKSGTMITKDFAIDSGITVFAVPGNVTSEKSKGTNEIIASMQGICALDTNVIFEEIGVTKNKKKKVLQLSMEESKILELLSDGEKDIEFLSENVNFDIKMLNSLLTTLEIKSIIKKMPGGFYAVC